MSSEVHKKKLVSVGNYVFTGHTLGKGNFARVEEAVHTILKIKVAIKIIDINYIKEEYVIKNLYREAKIMSKLNHPCIACLFQTMQRSDNVYYLVTEVASGGDLCAFVKKQVNGKLTEKQTKIFARQFTSAISHMHSLKVVHRDLKMENVMLNNPQTQIKIVDFGLSNFWSADSPLRTHCGSPEYAAPELFVTGKKYGPEVDLWSFGIILYGMVLGQLPFVTSRSTELSSQVRRKQLVAQINKGLSSAHRRALSSFTPEFRSLLSRLLVSDSTRRITTKELIDHPWITHKGNRIICTNPLKNLDSSEHSRLVGKINLALRIEPKVVSSTLIQEPLGKVGGIFNILKRRYQLSQIHGDGSSRTMPSLTIFELANLTKSLERESSTSAKGHTLKMLHTAFQKPQSAQTQTKITEFSQKIPLNDEKHTKQGYSSTEQEKSKSTKIKKKWLKIRPNTVQKLFNQDRHLEKIEETIRPSTVQPASQIKSTSIDYRNIKSPCLRRKVYSASITPKINSPSLKIVEKKSITSSKHKDISSTPVKPLEKFEHPKIILSDTKHKKKTLSPMTNKLKDSKTLENVKEKKEKTKIEHKKSSDLRIPKKQFSELSNAIGTPSVYTKGTRLRPYINNEISLRPPDANPENTNSKAEHRTRRRPTTSPLHEILETSLKTAEITTGASSSKSTKKHPGITGVGNSSKERNEDVWDRSHMAYGDYVSRASTSSAGHQRKLTIYDPIAKSIADYFTNNVSNKIHHYPWLKK